MRNTTGTGWCDVPNASKAKAFSERLSPADLIEFESLKTTSKCAPETTLFVEQQAPDTVIFLLAGQVKLSMNSSAGKRVILGIAFPGETLGLASVISGSRYEVTAETVSPCTIASVERDGYLQFLKRHPSVYGNIARELCLEYVRACEKVRRLGLAVTASAKLVLFLLDQCAENQETELGASLFCSLTHGEIGECIGVSRETVTRLFSDFKGRDLLESRGSTLIISDRRALEAYAGVE
jgi:CRP/FNR family transcriptional regulator, cyclic AMP receptor protein